MAAALFGAAVTIAAQSTQSVQPPTFRAESNLVRVDVAVVDRRGEPIDSLSADDFAVEEDGVAQTVQSFKFVSADGQPPPGDDVSLPIRSREHAAAEAARDEIRAFVIFWDEYHIGRFANAIKGRKALTDFVSTAFGPADLVALMDPLLPVDALKFTRDRRELTEKIAKLEGRFGVYMPTRSAAEDNMLERRDIARVRSEVTISALESAAVHLGSIKEGRKSIIFVSEGLTGLGMDQLTLIQELTDTANNNNTAIYTVDPAGLNGGSSDVLRTIAEGTGAEAFVNTNTPERAMRQVVREASAFYLLGYVSARNPLDGKFHKIGVKVKRSGVQVRARHGYWAPNATEIDKARIEAAAAEAIPAEVTSAAAVLSAARAERLVDVWIGADRGDADQTSVTVAWAPRLIPGRSDAARSVAVAVRNAAGEKTFEADLAAGALSFPSAPGPLQLRLTVRDAGGNTLDDDRRSFNVPDLSGSAVALSVPVLLRARTVADARAVADGHAAAPFAGREFSRADRVFVRVSVCGSNSSDAAVSARLTNKAGAPLVELTTGRLDGRAATYQIEVPIASLARGDYLLAIAAEHGEERSRAFVPLRIL